MSDDAARRERAEKSLLSDGWKRSDESYEWTRSFSDNALQQGFLHGYLAGAREESAINSAEIAKLQEAVRLVESALMLDLMQSGESVTAELLAINWIERPEVQRAIGAGQ